MVLFYPQWRFINLFYFEFIPGGLMPVQLGGHDSAFLPVGWALRLIITISSAQCRALLLEMKSLTSGSNDKQLMLVRSTMHLLCGIMGTDHILVHLSYSIFGGKAFRLYLKCLLRKAFPFVSYAPDYFVFLFFLNLLDDPNLN